MIQEAKSFQRLEVAELEAPGSGDEEDARSDLDPDARITCVEEWDVNALLKASAKEHALAPAKRGSRATCGQQ
eukprot:12891898-Prorocentrum_lima.AAC.1